MYILNVPKFAFKELNLRVENKSWKARSGSEL